MRRSGMKGGSALADYRISDVLGEKFIDFVRMLDHGDGYQDFLVKKLSSDKRPRAAQGTAQDTAQDTDISPYFTDQLIATIGAMRAIENPDIGKADAAYAFGTQMTAMVEKMITTTGIASYPFVTDTLTFDQLPYRGTNDLHVKHLIPGFNLLPFNVNIYPNHGATREINVLIQYLYHFISLLDLENTGVTGYEVVKFVLGDRLWFANRVTTLVTEIITYKKFDSPIVFEDAAKSIVYEGVVNGLSVIAQQIITDFAGVGKTPHAPIPLSDITTVDFTKNAEVKDFIEKKLGTTAIEATAIHTAFAAIKNSYTKAANVDNAIAFLHADYDEIVTNALLNAVVLDTTIVDDKLACDLALGISVAPVGGPGGPVVIAPSGPGLKFPSMPGTGTARASLPWLYKRIEIAGDTDNDKCVLPTYAKQGNQAANAKFVTNDAAVRTLFHNLIVAGGPIKNTTRVALIAIFTYMLFNKIATVAALNTEKPALQKAIQEALDNYEKVSARLAKIPSNDDLSKTLSHKLADEFASGFTQAVVKVLVKNTQGKYEPGTPQTTTTTTTTITTPANKPKLSEPEIMKFYKDKITEHIDFYDTFFNLIRTDTITKKDTTKVGKSSSWDMVPLKEALESNESEWDKYRLNVKKIGGYERLVGGRRKQRGGGGRYGDIVILQKIRSVPSYVTAIWWKAMQPVRIRRSSFGASIFEDLARAIFIDKFARDTTIVLAPFGEIDVLAVVREAIRTGRFGIDYDIAFGDLFKFGAEAELQPIFEENEKEIARAVSQVASQWQRIDGNFVRFENGEKVQSYPAHDNCSFFESTDECLRFFETCTKETSDTVGPDCRHLLEMKFNFTNFNANTVTEAIMKMNPMVAYYILRKFKFGSYTTDEPVGPFRNFTRYKIQSVYDWLAELKSSSDVCAKRGAAGCGSLREQLGEDTADKILQMVKDRTGKHFLLYLEVLVNWVNANPQVINPEEDLNPEFGWKPNYPGPDKSYDLYSWRAPHPKVTSLKAQSCGLERLKSSIMNDLAGAQGQTFISSVASTPFGIEMPLARPGFVNSLSPLNVFVSQVGGTYTEQTWKEINSHYGYDMFKNIYDHLCLTLGAKDGNCGKDVRLSNNTKNKIDKSLNTFKTTEEELRKEMISLLELSRVYGLSQGHIDPRQIDDEAKLRAVLAKHSNLLDLSSAYNRRAINLIDTFQAIASAVIGKLDKGAMESNGNVVTRPAKGTW